MIVALPVEESSATGKISQSFGRAPYFCFYDTEKGTSEFIENSAPASLGGAGIKAAQLVVDKKAEALLVPRCGENAARVLRGGGVGIYRVVDDSAAANIEAFVAGKLEELAEIHPGNHNHRG